MDFGDIFSRAWRIVWNNKFTFVLGFLAVLGSGSSNVSGSNFNYQFDSGDIPPGFAEEVGQFFARFGPLLLGLGCLLVIVGIVFWLIRLAAQAGLISAADRLDEGEKVTFGEAFGAGTSLLGRMAGINLLMYGPFALIGLIAAGIAVATVGTAVASEITGSVTDPEALFGALGVIGICFALLACILIPVYIVVTAIYPFAQRGAVLQDLGVTDSIGHGWRVLKANLGDIVLLIIFFVVLHVVFAFAVLIVLLPLGLVVFAPALIGMISRGAPEVTDIVFLIGGGICLGLVSAALQSILIAFRSTSVTLAYHEFVAKTA